MAIKAVLLKRTGLLTVAFGFTLMVVAGNLSFLAVKADAAQITSRSLKVSSSANGNTTTDIAGNTAAPGSGGNGAQTTETFTFTPPTSGNISSIEFLYCTQALGTCTPPVGLDTSTVSSVSGTDGAGWTIDSSTTANNVRIKSASPVNLNGTTDLELKLGNGSTGTDYIKNPTGDNTTFFVRITTFSDAGWTTVVDTGTVVSSTAQQVDITAKVQETLNLSVGTTPTDPGSGCAAFSDTGALALGDSNGVLDYMTAYAANSYFRLSTNAAGGTKILYSGDALKSGSNVIDSIGSAGDVSQVGTEQFGLGIDSSDTQGGFGYSFSVLSPTSPYGAANGVLGDPGVTFAFDTNSVTTPVEIASAATVVPCDTGSVRYLGNIDTTTPPGINTTKITYIAVPT
jgi:hypothetical protein